MRRRIGRPGIIGQAARTAATTAVVVGTANAMSRPRGQAAAPQAAPQPDYAPPPAPAQAGGLTDDKIQRLKDLAELKSQGILSEAEFEVEKAKLLA
jgi:hypothetical protein